MICRQIHHMKQRPNNTQRGIALGPILFIIAILAILAAAIAAGSGGFSASTNTESAKAMAEVVVQSCHAFHDAVDIMTMRYGCDPTALDFTPAGFPTGDTALIGGDFTAGNGTNRSGTGQCALFDPRGGAMTFKPLPSAAMASTTTGAYTTNFSSLATSLDALAGYPIFPATSCLSQVGSCSGTFTTNSTNANAPLLLSYQYISYNVCKQINNILGLSIDPNSTNSNILPTITYQGVNLSTNATIVSRAILYSKPSALQGCATDVYSNSSSAYIFTCALLVR